MGTSFPSSPRERRPRHGTAQPQHVKKVNHLVVHATKQLTAGPGPAASDGWCRRLDGAADRAQDLADLAAKEDEGDDRDDGDEGEDQRVLREALAVFATELGDECLNVASDGLLARWVSPDCANDASTM